MSVALRSAAETPRLYSGQDAARAVGLGWERFRKVRRAWVRDRDFPAELNEPGEGVVYLAAAVDAWLAHRARRVPAPPPPPPASAAPHHLAAARGRAALRLLQSGAGA